MRRTNLARGEQAHENRRVRSLSPQAPCWCSLDFGLSSPISARSTTMRIPSSALSRALVGCLTACVYAWHQRSLLRAERRALAELNEELLCEARLLAFELNKGGDPLAVVHDPCLPTTTPERALSDDARRTNGAGQSTFPSHHPDARGSRSTLLVAGAALWYRALPPDSRLAVRPNAIRRLLGSDGGSMRTQVIGVCGMSCSGKVRVDLTLTPPRPEPEP